jgi:hypothetical protein
VAEELSFVVPSAKFIFKAHEKGEVSTHQLKSRFYFPLLPTPQPSQPRSVCKRKSNREYHNQGQTLRLHHRGDTKADAHMKNRSHDHHPDFLAFGSRELVQTLL